MSLSRPPRVTVVGFGRRFSMGVVTWPRLLLTNGTADYVPDLESGICESLDGDFAVRLCPSALRRLRKIERERDAVQVTS